MAKIILKTSLANNTVSIPWAQVDATYNKVPKTTELIVSPIRGYIISASEFSFGNLPSIISGISFANTNSVERSKNKVIIRVSFNKYLSKRAITSVFLPLNIISRLSSNRIVLTDNTPIQQNIFVSDSPTVYKETTSSIGSKQNKYTIKGKPGAIIPVFTKTFTIPDGYSFVEAPSYKLSGNSNRYKITEQTQTEKGKVISKTFTVLCTLPLTTDRLLSNDVISFSAKVAVQKTAKLAKDFNDLETTKEDYKIYSIDTGKTVGIEGGFKKISIKGVPGTPFKIITSDGDGNMYNVKSGLFEAGGKVIEGVIPPVRLGFGYGEFKQWIKVPASASATTITTNVIEDKPVDHSKIVSTATAEKESTLSAVDDTQLALATLTIALKDGGAVDTTESPDGHPAVFYVFRPVFKGEKPSSAPKEFFNTEYLRDGTHTVGDGVAGESISNFIRVSGFPELNSGKSRSFSFLIAPGNAAGRLRINRQPKFSASDSYYRWNYSTQLGYNSEDTKDNTSTGVAINTDWGTSIQHTNPSDTSDGTDIDFTTNKWGIESFDIELEGIGKSTAHHVAGATESIGYNYIIVRITNIMGTFGNADLTMELNLKNFLSTYTPA